jgi:hypothetical protein
MNAQMNYQTEMSREIDYDLSLYIPHVFPNFEKEYVAGVFEDMEFGIVDHVDLVAKMDKNGKTYNAAYIHFSEWFNTTAVANFQERVINPDREARIVHDDPWFWIVLENKAKKYEPGARKPTLDLSTSEEESNDFTEIPIAPGLSQIILSPKMLDKINVIAEEEYSKFENKEDEVARLKTENQLLRETIKMHANYSNGYNKEKQNLNECLIHQMMLLKETEEILDEERQDNFIKLKEAEEMLDEERMEKMLNEEANRENTKTLLISILNSNTLDEAKEKTKYYMDNNF